jgi:hypothetical protein
MWPWLVTLARVWPHAGPAGTARASSVAAAAGGAELPDVALLAAVADETTGP